MKMRKIWMVLTIITTTIMLSAAVANATPKAIRQRVDKSFFGLFTGIFERDVLSGNAPEYIKFLKETGAGMARMEYRWEWLQPERDVWHWGHDGDRTLRTLAENDIIEPLVLISHRVPWVPMHPETKEITTDYIDYFGNFVFQVVSRHKGAVKYWQIINEPEITRWQRKETWIDMLKVAYKAAKKADPDCKIVLPGFAGSETQQLECTYVNGGGSYFDVVATHTYIFPQEIPVSLESAFIERIEALRKVMVKYGDGKKTIWITEMGWPSVKKEQVTELRGKKPQFSPRLVSEEESAKLLVRAYLTAISIPSIEKFFYFKLICDLGGHDIDRNYKLERSLDDCMGLFAAPSIKNLIPKAEFFAYKTLTGTLEGTTCEEQIALGEQIRCMRFRKGPHYILVPWVLEERAGFSVNIPASGINIFDIFGKEIVRSSGDAPVALAISDSPVYIVCPISQSERIIKLLENGFKAKSREERR